MLDKHTGRKCHCHLCSGYSSNTARGNKSWVAGQEMCRHMYLLSSRVSFHSCKWRRRTWKPFSKPCLHSFLLNSSHKVNRGCINMNLFPLSLPLGLSAVTLFTFLALWYFCFPFLFLCLFPPSSSLIQCHHLWTCSPTHSGHCQTGNVPGTYTVESTGSLAPHDHE